MPQHIAACTALQGSGRHSQTTTSYRMHNSFAIPKCTKQKSVKLHSEALRLSRPFSVPPRANHHGVRMPVCWHAKPSFSLWSREARSSSAASSSWKSCAPQALDGCHHASTVLAGREEWGSRKATAVAATRSRVQRGQTRHDFSESRLPRLRSRKTLSQGPVLVF